MRLSQRNSFFFVLFIFGACLVVREWRAPDVRQNPSASSSSSRIRDEISKTHPDPRPEWKDVEPVTTSEPAYEPQHPSGHLNAGASASAKHHANTKPLKDAIPPILNVRNEVRMNPHKAPPSVLRFSVQLASRMEESRNSETTALAFFEELSSCALTPPANTVVTVRALCLLNARRLATQHPRLLARWDELSEKADPDAYDLSQYLR